MSVGDIKKWQKLSTDFGSWNTPRQRRVQEKEAAVIISYLDSLRLDHYDILEIGCGNGYVARCIITHLMMHRKKFSYTCTDLIQESLNMAKKTLEDFLPHEPISFRLLDVYALDNVYAQGSQHIIISTGFVSAATYADAIPHVAQVLRTGGYLIADFVNILSPSIWLRYPLHALRQIIDTLKGKKESYHIGYFGIRTYFRKYGLDLLESHAVRLRRNPLVCLFKKM